MTASTLAARLGAACYVIWSLAENGDFRWCLELSLRKLGTSGGA